jgi:hypothetical protein
MQVKQEEIIEEGGTSETLCSLHRLLHKNVLELALGCFTESLGNLTMKNKYLKY